MTSDSRRNIAQRVLARMTARGFNFDDDARVQAAISDWIDGLIDMPELRARYQVVLEARRDLRFHNLHSRRVEIRPESDADLTGEE